MLYVINFKTYPQGTGERALKLAKIIEKVAKKFRKRVIICPQNVDIFRISQKVRIPVYAQHIDPVEFGSHTGWVLPETVKKAGASGTLINHSERRLPLKDIGLRVKRAKKLGLKTIVCAPGPKACKDVSRFKPDYVAIEPPELIGSGIPVSQKKPDTVIKARKLMPKNIPLLCGAGINDYNDVVKAKELGTVGVLVASAVVKAKNQEKAMMDLVGV